MPDFDDSRKRSNVSKFEKFYDVELKLYHMMHMIQIKREGKAKLNIKKNPVTLLESLLLLGQQNDYDRTSLEHKARKISGGKELFQTVF